MKLSKEDIEEYDNARKVTRAFGLHSMTVLFLILVPIFVIPDLSTDVSDYNSNSTILIKTQIHERDRGWFRKPERSLQLFMEDGTLISLSSSFSNYWGLLQKKENIGKNITYYSNRNGSYIPNPNQLELDKKIVYTTKEGLIWKYLILLMTIGLSIYSGKKLRDYFLVRY